MPAARANPPREQAAVARMPRRRAGLAAWLARFAPSWRSLVVGALLLGAAGGAYVAAFETSVFAVRTIEVEGAPPAVAAEVRSALGPIVGTSLLKVGGGDIQRRLAALPSVAAASYDRAFPHTLRVYVRTERPLAVVRKGAQAWVVAPDDRILRQLRHPARSSLPRIWLSRSASVADDETLADEQGTRAVAALGALRAEPLGVRVLDVRTGDAELTLILRSGLELRLGDATNLRLKLAVARRILPELGPPGYLDVTVPTRAVAAANPKLGG